MFVYKGLKVKAGLVLTLLFLILLSCFGFAKADEAILRGIVIDSEGLPVRGAQVTIQRSSVSAVSDSTGAFSVTVNVKGTVTVVVTVPESVYEDVVKNVTVPRTETTPLVIVVNKRVYQADETMIVGSSASADSISEKSTASVSVVTRQEFADKASTIADIVMSTPSTTVTSMGGLGSFTEVSLRGAYSNQVQVYLDGMLLNEAIGGAVNLATIPLSNVESVEVWRSGAPSRFGGDAVGGAININTRDIRTSTTALTTSFGSFNTFTAGGVVSVPLNSSRFMATADIASSKNDFEYTSDNGTSNNPDDDYTAKRSNDEYRSATILTKYNRAFANGAMLELTDTAARTEKNIPAAQHLSASHASLTTSKNLFQGRVTWKPSGFDVLEIAPTVQSIYSHEHYMDDDNTIGWGRDDNTYNTTVWAALVPLELKWNELIALTLTPTAKQERFRPSSELDATVPLSCNRNQLAIVADALLMTPNRFVTINGTVRRDRYYSSYKGQPNTYVPVVPEPVYNFFTHSQAGIRLKMLPWMTLKGNYGDVWREPSLYELFGDRGRTVSRPGLKPEHVFKYDTGAHVRLPDNSLNIAGSLESTYFENNYRDIIQWYANSYGFIEPFNIKAAYVKGTELVWNIDMAGRLSCHGNCTFQRSKVTDTAKSYHLGKKLPNRPARYGSVIWELPVRKANLFWITDYKGSYYLDRSNQLHRRYPGRTLHSIGVTAPLFKDSLTGTFSIKNLRDMRTYDVLGMPKPGRSYTISLTYSL